MPDIVWTNAQHITPTGNDVEKTGGLDGNPDAWADGNTNLASSGDYFEWIVPQTNKLLTVGIYNTAHTAAGISHGLTFSAGTAEIREAGIYKGETSHSVADVWRMAVISGVVRYYKNGVEFTGSTQDAITLPKPPTVLINGSNGRVTDATISSGAAPTVPIDYNAITDRVVRSDSVVPTAPAKGGGSNYLIDPNYYCRIVRATDSATATVAGTTAGLSYKPPTAPNQRAFNSTSTLFYVRDDNGNNLVHNFNATTGAISFNRLVTGVEPAFSKLTSKSNIIYCVRFISDHVISKFDFSNPGAGYVTVLDLKTIDGSLDGSVYTSSLYTSAGPVERCAVNYGGAGQNLHYKITMFDVDTPTNRRTINMLTDTIDGVALLDETGAAFTFAGVRSHSISLSGDGNFLHIDAVGTSSYYWLYDWTLNRIKKVTYRAAGHYAMGRTKAANEDASGSSKPQWQVRSLALANVNSVDPRISTPVTGVLVSGDHTSWHNSQQNDSDNSAPFFSDWQTCFGEAHNIFSNEIIGIQSTGPEKVWRFCHHHMDPNGDATGSASAPFEYQVWSQVDPSGQWVMFGSNWGKTLGSHSSPPSSEVTERCDTFLVRLSMEANLTVSATAATLTATAGPATVTVPGTPGSGIWTLVTGSLYDARTGAKVTSGKLYIRPNNFINNGNHLVAPKTVSYTIPGTGNISITLAQSNGVDYTVEFDPNPADTVTPLKQKPGYFANVWTVPVSGPVDISDL